MLHSRALLVQRNNGSFELHLSSFLIFYNVFKILLKSQLKFYALLHIFAGFTSWMCNVYESKFQKNPNVNSESKIFWRRYIANGIIDSNYLYQTHPSDEDFPEYPTAVCHLSLIFIMFTYNSTLAWAFSQVHPPLLFHIFLFSFQIEVSLLFQKFVKLT